MSFAVKRGFFSSKKKNQHHEHIEEKSYNIADFLNKIDEKDVEYIRRALTPLNPYDKSDVLNSIKEVDLEEIINDIYDILEPESIIELDYARKKMILDKIGVDQVTNTLLRLENDDIIAFISGIEEVYHQQILNYVPRQQRKALKLALTYTPDQVGRLMDVDFISFGKDTSVLDAKNVLLKNGDHLSTNTRDIFVLDDDGMLIGMVNILLILTSDDETPLMSILKDDFKTIHDIYDKSEIVYIFNKYNLTSLPVIDREGKMIGFVSSDIAREITVDEGNEDILRLGGGVIINDDNEDLMKRIYTRFIWLFVNLNTSFISATVIRNFEGTIGKYSFLAALFPIVASIGGNSGMQTIALVVRMIAMRSLHNLNRTKIMVREIFISVINSMMFVAITFIFSYLMYHNVTVSIIFSIAISINICISTVLGFIIPLIMKKLGTDPAITSSIFLTTATDCLGFGIFLFLVTLFADHIQ